MQLKTFGRIIKMDSEKSLSLGSQIQLIELKYQLMNILNCLNYLIPDMEMRSEKEKILLESASFGIPSLKENMSLRMKLWQDLLGEGEQLTQNLEVINQNLDRSIPPLLKMLLQHLLTQSFQQNES